MKCQRLSLVRPRTRTCKQVGAAITYYVYSDEGLVAEYDASGAMSKGYGWKPDSIWGTDPVFMVEGGQYYYYHNDHLGTPQKMTDGSGNVAWSAEYAAFGQALVTVSTVTNNLRFPGQYFDEETGLHYNWQRYYDPVAGRYTQVDQNSNETIFYRCNYIIDEAGETTCEKIRLTFPDGLTADNKFEIFARCAESRSRAFGAAFMTYDPEFDLAIQLGYGNDPDDHSRQFNSNISRENSYWNRVINDFGL